METREERQLAISLLLNEDILIIRKLGHWWIAKHPKRDVPFMHFSKEDLAEYLKEIANIDNPPQDYVQLWNACVRETWRVIRNKAI